MMVASILVSTAGVGCAATTAMAPASVDAQAHTAVALPDRALVYLYRSESFGGAVKMGVMLDGVYSGQTVPKGFMLWELAPGRHLVTSSAENEAQLDLHVEPGHTYFVWQEIKMGLMLARSRLQLVPEQEARSELARCHLIAMPVEARAFNVGRPAAGPAAAPMAALH